MKLSILIPTLESRKDKLTDLLNQLYAQSSGLDIHICTLANVGTGTIGFYRQRLLEMAIGDYIAFVDDDDEIAPDYISKILNAIETNPDCCSLTGELRWVSNGTTEPFEHSLQYDNWEKKDGIYLRYPNHLNAVKRSIALQVGFKDMGHGEDRDYSDRLKPLLKTEAKIDGVLYYYNCRG